MAGSGPGASYMGPWPEVTPKGMQFLRKAAFLTAHPEWSIDYDREIDAYVAIRRDDEGGQTIITSRMMKELLDNAEKVSDQQYDEIKGIDPGSTV